MKNFKQEISKLNSKKEKTPPFFAITADLAKMMYSEGYLTSAGYLFMLKGILTPPGIPLKITDLPEFLTDWNLTRATFYRALSKLEGGKKISTKVIGTIVISDPEPEDKDGDDPKEGNSPPPNGDAGCRKCETDDPKLETVDLNIATDDLNVATASPRSETENLNIATADLKVETEKPETPQGSKATAALQIYSDKDQIDTDNLRSLSDLYSDGGIKKIEREEGETPEDDAVFFEPLQATPCLVGSGVQVKGDRASTSNLAKSSFPPAAPQKSVKQMRRDIASQYVTAFSSPEAEDEFYLMVRGYTQYSNEKLTDGQSEAIAKATVRRINAGKAEPSDRELLRKWELGELDIFRSYTSKDKALGALIKKMEQTRTNIENKEFLSMETRLVNAAEAYANIPRDTKLDEVEAYIASLKEQEEPEAAQEETEQPMRQIEEDYDDF